MSIYLCSSRAGIWSLASGLSGEAGLAYFAETKNAELFSDPIENTNQLLVPTVVMYEVTKVLLREKDEDAAIVSHAHMHQGMVLELTGDLAVSAAEMSLAHHLPMADSINLATAHKYSAIIWTQDAHFKNLAHVNYFSV